jgi:superfamily I DNA/RNA helicase/mRNA-degrading endonuclease RelE of RelBE toxin-antitoxin system
MAEIALSREFLSAYARLPRKAQRKLDELLTKFRQNSTAAAIHVEPLHRVADPLLRSARIGDDYRVILRAPERGDLFIALWADHHDEAYRWAENKQTAVHPATGTLQIFDVSAATRAVTELAAESPASSAPPDLFSGFDDEALFLAGVPRALLPSVRAVVSDEDFERLAPHLPPEAGEVLTGLAAGLSLDDALQEVLGRPAAAVHAPEPEPVDIADVRTALEREGTQRQFLLLNDALDLDAALRHPLDAWRVFLHPKQRRIARARTQGPTRITGSAGTGKTVVALHRAAFLVREVFQKPDDRVLVTTFAVNLAHDLRAQLAKLLGPDDLARVEIVNIDRWASEYLRKQGESFQQVFGDEQRRLFRQVHDVYGVDGYDFEFCLAEWRDVVQEQDIRSEEAYVKAVRRFRGVPLSRAQRRELWQLFSEYRQILEDDRRFEPIDVIRRARSRLEVTGLAARYQAVVVDETQDFSAEALKLVRVIAGPEHPDDLFLVGDAHQRIYGRAVPLSSCGISVRGRRSQTLRINYRTTAAISRFAFGALRGVHVDDLDDGKAELRASSLRDGSEPVLKAFDSADEEERAVAQVVKAALNRGVTPDSIAVVARTKSLLTEHFGPALDDAGIEWALVEQEEPRRTAVRLATLHRVKGLEFPVVIVGGASDEVLPYPSPELSSEDPIVRGQALLRERCLLYVATSRARDELYVFCHGTPTTLLSVSPRKRSVPPVAAVESSPPVQDAESPDDSPASPPLEQPNAEATPLVGLPLPTRMANFVERKELRTVADLAAIAPSDLLEERNLGRGSIAETRPLLEPLLGMTWERFAAAKAGNDSALVSMEPPSLARAAGSGNWDVVRTVLSEVQLETPLAHIELSARARGYAEREKVASLRELASRSRAELVAAPNLGRGTVKDLAVAVAGHFVRLEQDRLSFDAGLNEGFRGLLQSLEPMERIIVSRRSGMSGTQATLEQLGELFGVTRERIRQIEARACEALALRVGWSEPARAKISEAVSGGAVSLESLEADAWWRGAAAAADPVEYVVDSVLGLELRVVSRGEGFWLSPWSRQEIERASAELRGRLHELVLPVPLSDVERLIHELAGPLGSALEQELTEEALGMLHIEHVPDGLAHVVGVGQTRRVEVLAFLRASPTPVRIEAVYEALGGRIGLPDEVLNFDRGVVGLRQHFPDYDVWKARLVPASVALMLRLGPERQWATAELLEELREEYDFPEAFNAYWLGALLKDTPDINYLGRNRVALPQSASAENRIYIHEALEKLLREAGAPVPRSTLLERLEAQLGASEIALNQVFGRPQFVRLGEDRVGLRSRDIPGGEAAAQEAADLIASVLARRELGLSAWQAHEQVVVLSAQHELWHRDLTLSILRNDDRFRLNQAGSIGLTSWESTRVPTRLELLRSALEASDGAVSVEALEAKIAAHYGEPPTRASIAGMANKLGATLDGEWIRIAGK